MNQNQKLLLTLGSYKCGVLINFCSVSFKTYAERLVFMYSLMETNDTNVIISNGTTVHLNEDRLHTFITQLEKIQLSPEIMIEDCKLNDHFTDTNRIFSGADTDMIGTISEAMQTVILKSMNPKIYMRINFI